MATSLDIVLGDFDAQRAQDVARSLESLGYHVTVAASGVEVLEACRSHQPAAAIIEPLLPRGNGFEVLKSLKRDPATANVRVLVFADVGDDYGRQRAELCGADAVTPRPSTESQLESALKALFEPRENPSAHPALDDVLTEMQVRSREENPLLHHITDGVTGLFNQAYTDLKLADEVKKARRFHVPLTLMAVGLDSDSPQDTITDDGGSVLNEVAGILLCESRDIDHLARYESSLFVAVLPHTDGPGAAAMAERIVRSIECRGFRSGSLGTPVTASVGIAPLSDGDPESGADLIRRAKDAMLGSRRWGGNRVTTAPPDPKPTAREA